MNPVTPEPPAPPPGGATRDYRRDSLAPFRPLLTDSGVPLPESDAAPRSWLTIVGLAATVWLVGALVLAAVVGAWLMLGRPVGG